VCGAQPRRGGKGCAVPSLEEEGRGARCPASKRRKGVRGA
jgi:hypothetical protein